MNERMKVGVDAVIESAIAEQRIVGAVVLVAHGGQIVYDRAAGLADREAGKPMRTDTLFRLASVTKPVVSVAALKLVSGGKLALEDRVERWLPDFKPRLESGEAAPITVRQLLTHTAGLGYTFAEGEDGPYHRAGVSDGFDQPGLSMGENLKRLATAPLLYRPGQQWRYSLAMDVLGGVIESATGKPLPQIVEELITTPLGLSDTAFAVKGPDRLAAPYFDGHPPQRMAENQIVPAEGGMRLRFAPGRIFHPRSYASGGAGMAGSAPELLKFFETLRQGGGSLLPGNLAAALMSNQIGELRVQIMGPGWAFGYGGAVLMDPVAAQSPQSAGTWTWGGVYGHSWFVDPARQLTVVAFTNTSLEGMYGRFTVELRDAIYRAL